MIDLTIERLNLQIVNGAGHEHRIQSITAMAVALIGDELVHLGRGAPANVPTRIGAISAAPASLDLQRNDDKACARAMADSVLEAIRLRVEG